MSGASYSERVALVFLRVFPLSFPGCIYTTYHIPHTNNTKITYLPTYLLPLPHYGIFYFFTYPLDHEKRHACMGRVRGSESGNINFGLTLETKGHEGGGKKRKGETEKSEGNWR
ncbi:hypothetical protein F5X96DRAFT_8424 [Biscogniauxia mediterranea]|nr:hypothetical protein F5X96DRAFT_8424 [Biscogniauxia mediterranea]